MATLCGVCHSPRNVLGHRVLDASAASSNNLRFVTTRSASLSESVSERLWSPLACVGKIIYAYVPLWTLS